MSQQAALPPSLQAGQVRVSKGHHGARLGAGPNSNGANTGLTAASNAAMHFSWEPNGFLSINLPKGPVLAQQLWAFEAFQCRINKSQGAL